jgi:hypothetical protein
MAAPPATSGVLAFDAACETRSPTDGERLLRLDAGLRVPEARFVVVVDRVLALRVDFCPLARDPFLLVDRERDAVFV